jgi:hypothetical protein
MTVVVSYAPQKHLPQSSLAVCDSTLKDYIIECASFTISTVVLGRFLIHSTGKEIVKPRALRWLGSTVLLETGTPMGGRELFHFEPLQRICAIARRFDVVALKVQGVGVKFPGKWISVYDEQLRATQGVDGNRSTIVE